MDTVSSCKKKLAHFRIKELKDVLTQLGLVKQGKKQDLMDRILALLSNEVSDMHGLAKKNAMGKQGVAEIINDTYRKLQGTGAIDSSTNGESFLVINNVNHREEVVDSTYLDKKVHCPCGSSLPTEYMIQCADPKCHVLQHVCCVIIPDDCSEGISPIPSQFYCEICRINRADPFWVTVAHPLPPVKLIASNIPADGTNPVQNVERTFQVTIADIHLLQNAEYDVQAWCILLSDKVPYRMQWPLYADLKVNGVPVRTVNRPGSQPLGANGRDDGPMIAFYLAEGINQISLSGCDARSFCLGVRLVNQRTVQQILNLIPKEQEGEPFEDALARVRRCIGGGLAMANEDSDDDLEVIADSVTVNLRCPMSGSRIRTAGRFRLCAHMGCFDLETFVQLNQRSRKWQCPICLKNYSLEDIIIDPYFNRITNMMQDCGEDVTEIDVKPDGCWRVKNDYQFKNLEQWHNPDGSVCISIIGVVSNLEASRQMSSTKQVCKPWEMHSHSSRNRPEEYFENYSQKVVTMSSSSYESHRVDGDQSVCHFGIGNSDISANNGHEINSMSYNFNATARTMNDNTCTSLRDDLDVIFLSDSEEENANLTSFETVSRTGALNDGGHSFCGRPGISNAYSKDLAIDAGSQIQLFHTDTDVSDALIDSEYTPASLRPGTNDEARSNGTTDGKKSYGPFSFPRQPRSVRRHTSHRF